MKKGNCQLDTKMHRDEKVNDIVHKNSQEEVEKGRRKNKRRFIVINDILKEFRKGKNEKETLAQCDTNVITKKIAKTVGLWEKKSSSFPPLSLALRCCGSLCLGTLCTAKAVHIVGG